MSIFFSRPYTLKRTNATGSIGSGGFYTEGSAQAPVTIQADIQPLTGKELESLNIGRDNLGKIKIFTDENLIITIPGTNGTNLQNGDKIVFDSNDYEIIAKFKYESGIISHNEYIGELRL